MPDPLRDIRNIDDDIRDEVAQVTRHQLRCDGRCQAWRDHTAELDRLFDLRLRFMDRRDTAVIDR